MLFLPKVTDVTQDVERVTVIFYIPGRVTFTV